jgi:hypothetical protein
MMARTLPKRATHLSDLCPSDQKKTEWPTIVFESGVSESLVRLRSDAGWWLEKSGSDVKIVITVLIRPAESKLLIEKWGAFPSNAIPRKT